MRSGNEFPACVALCYGLGWKFNGWLLTRKKKVSIWKVNGRRLLKLYCASVGSSTSVKLKWPVWMSRALKKLMSPASRPVMANRRFVVILHQEGESNISCCLCWKEKDKKAELRPTETVVVVGLFIIFDSIFSFLPGLFLRLCYCLSSRFFLSDQKFRAAC